MIDYVNKPKDSENKITIINIVQYSTGDEIVDGKLKEAK